MLNIHEFAETLRKMDDSLSKTIKISRSQVLEIIVDELAEKYKFNAERNDKEWASAFEKVLQYYLDEDEIRHLTKRAPDARKFALKSRSKNNKGSAKPARG